MENKQLSDVEKFFYAAQAKLGGNLKWEELSLKHQLLFVEAVNTIKILCEAVHRE